MFETKKISTDRETKLVCVCVCERVRERERVLTCFVMDNLEGIEEWGGNGIIRNLYKN